MKKQTLVIIGILILVIVGVYLYMRTKKATNTSAIHTSGGASSIPAEVLREPTADWIGESLTVGGVKFVVVNGQWQRA